MAVSVAEPVGEAIEWTRQILFRPFELKKWLVLGFCAFLTQLGRGGCSGSGFNFRAGGGGGAGPGAGRDMERALDRAGEWLMANLGTILLVSALVVVVGLGVYALLLWLSSRGEFMFLDGVVRDRAGVKEPWERYRHHANSLFALRFLLTLAWAFMGLMLLGGAVLIALPDLRAGRFTGASVAALIVVGAVGVCLGLLFALVQALLTDFVVPAMYVRGPSATAACSALWHELIRPNLGTFALFYLLKIALSIAAGVIVMLGACLTCCIAALPYVNAVVFLPILVFFRSFPLFLLARFGDEWDPGLGAPREPTEPAPEGHAVT